MNQAVFTGGLRTPFGKAKTGTYKDTRPDDLLSMLLSEQLNSKTNKWGIDLKNQIQDVIVGTAYPEGEQGYNIGRVAGLGAGLNVPGMTVNRLCASSLEAVAQASLKVMTGMGDTFLVGGVESMSRIPRRGANFSESDNIKEENPNTYVTMGETAENVYQRTKISRNEQEDFAMRSHELAHKAYENKFYPNQIWPYLINKDESLRWPIDAQKLASLKPAFQEDGVVTAATSSPMNDGASSAWVISLEQAQKFGTEDVLIIKDITWAAVQPELMGMGPVPAIRKIFQRNSLTPNEISAFELNEAFSVQAIACVKELEINLNTVNTCGGALALGHPLGASGLRLMMTLQDRLRQSHKDGALGIASLCVGGGQGMAILVEFKKLK